MAGFLSPLSCERTAAYVAVFVAVASVCLIAPGAAAECPTWSGSQNVIVRSGNVTTLAPPNCRYMNLNITVYCETNSTLIIYRFTLIGGFLAIVGPNMSSPGNISDVSVKVDDSTIEADVGPAVGVIIGFGSNTSAVSGLIPGTIIGPGLSFSENPFTASNVSLYAHNSTLTSTSSTAAVALGLTLAEGAINFPTKLSRISIDAERCTLRATATGINTAASAAGLAWGLTIVIFGYLDIDRMRITLLETTAAASVACTRADVVSSGTAAAAGIAVPGLAGDLTLSEVAISVIHSVATSFTSSTGQCPISVVSASAAVAAGEVLGGAVTFDNVNISAVSSTVSSLAIAASNASGTDHVAASVGFATGYITAPSGFTDINFFAVLSNTTSNASCWYPGTRADDGWVSFTAASATASIAVGKSDYLVSFTRVSLAVLWGAASSDVNMTTNSMYIAAAASVAGTAFGNAFDGVEIDISFFYASSGSIRARVATLGGPARAAAAIAAHVEAGQRATSRVVPKSSITASRFLVAGGVASANSTVLITRWNVSYARALAGAGAVAAPLQPGLSSDITSQVSHATACASAAATYHGGRSHVFGEAFVARVENVTLLSAAPSPLTDCVVRPVVTVTAFPSCLHRWLGPFTDTLSASPSLSASSSPSRSRNYTSATRTYEDDGSSVVPAGVLSVQAAATNQIVVATVATGASVVSSPGAAMQASRALSIIALSQCNFDYDGRVDFPVSMWPGFAIDLSKRGAFLRGGVVAALSTVVAVAIIIGVVALFISTVMKSPLHSAASFVRYPGVITVPIGVTLDGLVTCAVAALIHGESRAADTILAVAVVLYLFAVTVAAIITGYRLPAVASEYGDRPTTGSIDAYLRGERGWSARAQMNAHDLPLFGAPPRSLHLAFGSVFKKYTVDRRWFYVADTWITVFVSVAKGTMPTTLDGCYIATGVVMALCGVMAGLSILTRPYVSPAKNALLILTNFLSFGAALLVFAAMALDASTLLKSGQGLALLSGYVSIGNVGISIYGEFATRRLAKKEHHRRGDEGADATPMLPRTEASRHAAADENGDGAAHALTNATFASPLALLPARQPIVSETHSESPPAPGNSTPPPQASANITRPPSRDNVSSRDNGSSEGSLRFLPSSPQRRDRGDTMYAPVVPRVITRTTEGQALFDELEDMLRNRSRVASRVSSAMPSRAQSGDRLFDGGFVPLETVAYTLL